MALCGLVALALGYLIGLRFRVMIVLPIEMAALAATAALVAVGHVGTGDACLGFVILTVALQIGYGLALACPFSLRSSAGRHPAKA